MVLERARRGEPREPGYEVRTVLARPKYGEVLRLLQEALQEKAARSSSARGKKTVEEVAAFLKEAGLDCAIFTVA